MSGSSSSDRPSGAGRIGVIARSRMMIMMQGSAGSAIAGLLGCTGSPHSRAWPRRLSGGGEVDRAVPCAADGRVLAELACVDWESTSDPRRRYDRACRAR